MIKVRKMISGWQEVTKEQAREWVKFKMNNTQALSERDKKEYIQSKITGITVDELLGEKNEKKKRA